MRNQAQVAARTRAIAMKAATFCRNPAPSIAMVSEQLGECVPRADRFDRRPPEVLCVSRHDVAGAARACRGDLHGILEVRHRKRRCKANCFRTGFRHGHQIGSTPRQSREPPCLPWSMPPGNRSWRRCARRCTHAVDRVPTRSSTSDADSAWGCLSSATSISTSVSRSIKGTSWLERRSGGRRDGLPSTVPATAQQKRGCPRQRLPVTIARSATKATRFLNGHSALPSGAGLHRP